MRFVAKCFALGMFIVGAVGVIEPGRLIGITQFVLTPSGLYAIAALRIAMGLVLIMVAPGSRAPRALAVLGVLILVAGVATPLFGLERSRAIAEWAVLQDPGLLRGIGGLLGAVGAFIALATATVARRPAPRRD